MGCQDTMPTLLEWPSNTTTGSDRGVSSPFSGICQTWIRQDKGANQGEGNKQR